MKSKEIAQEKGDERKIQLFEKACGELLNLCKDKWWRNDDRKIRRNEVDTNSLRRTYKSEQSENGS